MTPLIHSARYSDKTTEKFTHYHDCHQIIFIQDGKIEPVIDHRKLTAQSGDLLIISRFEHHSIRVLSEPYRRYVLKINPFELSRDHPEYSIFFNRPCGFQNLLNISDCKSEFVYIFQKILKEFHHPDKFSDEMQQYLLSQLMIMISRRLPEEAYVFSDPRFEVIFDLQKRLANQCGSPYRLDELAKEYHISSSSLSHQFKKITGYSIVEYLGACRMAMAKKYLAQTDLPIAEVVEKCGFSDCSNFSRNFKSINGITPSQFRSKYQPQKF